MLLIKANRDALLKPLQSVTGIVERRQTMPILANVLIEMRDDSMHFVATDNEIQITAKARSDGEAQSARITTGARKLQDILRSLPDQASVRIELQDGRLHVKSGHGRFNLQTLPAEDFPKLSEMGEISGRVETSQRQLKRLLSLVQYAMAQQDIRYYLNGMLLVLDGNELKVVATDGHRLAYASCGIGSENGRMDIILPRKTVMELSRLLSDTEDPVRIDLLQNQARFVFGDIDLITKVIDGKFPDYNRVIPSGYSRNIALERAPLLQALQRAAILTNDKVRGVRLVLSENRLNIICSNTEHEEAQEEIEISYSGGDLDIGFNISYLLDVLTNIDAQGVVFSFADSSSSLLVSIPDRDDFKYVVMPMRI